MNIEDERLTGTIHESERRGRNDGRLRWRSHYSVAWNDVGTFGLNQCFPSPRCTENILLARSQRMGCNDRFCNAIYRLNLLVFKAKLMVVEITCCE